MSTKIGWDFILIDTSASMIVNGGDMKKGIKDLFSKQIKDGSNNKFILLLLVHYHLYYFIY